MELGYCNERPMPFKAAGNGTWIYCWDIEQIDDNLWQCHHLNIGGELTSSTITLAVIEAMWNKGVEQKLINDYNAALMGLLDESHIDAYEEFLIARKAIKEQIDADCQAVGIN